MCKLNAATLSFYIKNEQKYKVVEYISSFVGGNPMLSVCKNDLFVYDYKCTI